MQNTHYTRKLSFKYHPDRNPDDPKAAAKFQQLTKAMECFADEKSRENCDKFGNPDGTGGVSV
jgi:DnaJ-class molecular chaperone